MAAAASQLGGEALDASRKTATRFAEDPVAFLVRVLRALGVAMIAAGILFYIGKRGTGRSTQQFLNDANNRLGLAPSTPPTPPPANAKLPAPPPYAVQYQAIVNAILDLDNVNPANAASQLLGAQAAATTLYGILNGAVTTTTYPGPVGSTPGVCPAGSTLVYNANDNIYMCVLSENVSSYAASGWVPATGIVVKPVTATVYTLTPPPGVDNDLSSIITLLGNAANVLLGLPPVGGAPTGNGADWASAKSFVTSASNSMIALGSDLSLPAPFVFVNQDSATAPQPNNSFWNFFTGPGASAFAAISNAGAAAIGGVENAVGTAFNDVEQFAGDVGQAVAFVGKALMNAPFLVWDGLGYGVSWGLNTLFTDTYQLLLAAGFALLAVSIVLDYAFPRVSARIELGSNALNARFWNGFDRWFGSRRKVATVREQLATEAAISSVNEDVREVEKVPDSNTPAETSHKTPPLLAPDPEPAPEPEKPLPLATPTVDVEAQLGEASYPEAKRRMRDAINREAAVPLDGETTADSA